MTFDSRTLAFLSRLTLRNDDNCLNFLTSLQNIIFFTRRLGSLALPNRQSTLDLGEINMRMFKVTACVPSQTRIRTQRELQNTYFTKLVPYDNWFREQQRIMKMGGKIMKVELATGKQGMNTGLS